MHLFAEAHIVALNSWQKYSRANSILVQMVSNRYFRYDYLFERFPSQNRSPYAIVTHHNHICALHPKYRTILAVVLNLPDASRCLYQYLVAVVELRVKFPAQRRRVAEGGYLRVLVEVARNVSTIRAKIKRSYAVADVVILIGVLGRRERRPSQFDCKNQFIANIVTVFIDTSL